MSDALARAGLAARSAWCESELLERRPSEWHVVWGRTRGLLVDDEGVAATFDPGEGVPLALRIALDEAAARGERPAVLRVHAEGEAPLPDLARWSGECGIRCEADDTWDRLVRAAPRAPLNLLQGDLAPRSAASWKLPRAAVVLIAVVAALQLGFTAIETFRLQRERGALEARREAVFREAFPEARVVVDPELQMARNLAELQRTRGLPGGDEFLVQMTREAHARGAQARSVEFANGRLTAK
jgi:general secretion pathway protein L